MILPELTDELLIVDAFVRGGGDGPRVDDVLILSLLLLLAHLNLLWLGLAHAEVPAVRLGRNFSELSSLGQVPEKGLWISV